MNINLIENKLTISIELDKKITDEEVLHDFLRILGYNLNMCIENSLDEAKNLNDGLPF